MRSVSVRSLSIGLMGLCLGGMSQPAIADSTSALLLLTEPLNMNEVNQLRLGQVPSNGSVVTANTISQTGLTVPSLWWAEEQFGGKLLDYWIAYQGNPTTPQRVDLLVNPQVWVRYTYLERYSFLSRFGKSAGDFGYSTRIFNWQGDLLGAYVCQFDSTVATTAPVMPQIPENCQVFLDSTGAGALSGASPVLPLSTTGGIAP
ncbi:MAG TPA: hypothetical protein V6C65_16120 [Allocoleopsis sp.]